jgi:hypothetical protein
VAGGIRSIEKSLTLLGIELAAFRPVDRACGIFSAASGDVDDFHSRVTQRFIAPI